MKDYFIRSGLFGRKRKLKLDGAFISFETSSLIGEEFTTIQKEDISDIRYGIEWISWYKFTVGKEYCISVKTKNERELTIQFKNYFRLNSEYSNIYSEIVDTMWQNYFKDVVIRQLQLFDEGHEMEYLGITLTHSGIRLREKDYILGWEDVGTKQYHRYFAIFEKGNPIHHSRVSFNEYGSEILWSMVNYVLKEYEESKVRANSESM